MAHSYRFMTEAIAVSGYLRTLQFGIGGLSLSMAVLGCITAVHPLGPSTTAGRTALVLVSLSAIPVGLWWMFGRWPSFGQAVAFVAWGDFSLAVAAVLAATPEARIATVINMALIGVFVSFLLGPWVLAAHVSAVAALILGLAAHAVLTGQRPWYELYMFVTPAMAAVVVMPIVIQAVIEGGRRAVARTAWQAMRDPMTGLRNRRGMYEAVGRLIAQRGHTVVVAAVIDLDRFKQLNDDRGHEYGDAAIRAMADGLKAVIRTGDVAARLGGDEFAVIATMDGEDGQESFAERMRAAMDALPGTFTASVGVASVSGPTPDEDLVDEVLRHADRALYEAKRQGGNRLEFGGPERSDPGLDTGGLERSDPEVSHRY